MIPFILILVAVVGLGVIFNRIDHITQPRITLDYTDIVNKYTL